MKTARIFHFLVVKLSIYLNRRVFIMQTDYIRDILV